MPRKLFAFVGGVSPEEADLPGVWRNKRGSGYRVPYNLYPVLGWSLPHHETISDLDLARRVQVPGLVPGMDTYLKPYQKHLLKKALALPGAHIWAPPGAGKTLVGLVYLAATSQVGVKLVITKAGARGTWAEQCARYTSYEPELLLGQRAKEPKGGWRTDRVYITAWETLKYWGAVLAKAKPAGVVWDEIHWLRRPKHTKAIVMETGEIRYEGRGNSLDFARQIAGASGNKLGMTATPIPGRVRDLWTQLDMVEPWQWGSFHQFGVRYCQGTHNGHGFEYKGLSNAHELRERLRYVKARVGREEVNQYLPQKRREVIRLEVTEQDKPVAMKRDIAKALKQAKSGSEDGKATYFETLLMEAATRKYSYVTDRVMTALRSKQKVVVFTGRRKDCERLGAKLRKKAETLPGATVWVAHGGTDPQERDAIRQEYMAHPGPALLVGTGDAWGESVNLQDTDLALISMLPWTPDKVLQWEGRFARLGQKRPVLVTYIIARATVDEQVADLLLEKLPHVGSIAGDVAAEEIEGALGGVDESEGFQERLLGNIVGVIAKGGR